MVNIICASYFDPLGHPLFADKIAENASNFLGKSEKINIFGVSLENREIFNNETFLATPIHIPFLGNFFNLTTRNNLERKFSHLGKIIFFFIRMTVCTIFYFKVYRNIALKDFLLDLEYEPIQSFLASIFLELPSNHTMVLHSFPKNYKNDLKSFYKLISRYLLKKRLKKNNMTRLALMHEKAISYAKSQGFFHRQLVLAGWGFDKTSDYNNFEKKKPISNCLEGLSFGVLRKDKRIEKLVKLFLKINDSKFALKIIGKSFDIDVKKIKKDIEKSKSNTNVSIIDRYVKDQEIQKLFENSDFFVISHDASFDSASGPLALALQYKKPVLCFSSNFVSSLVRESNFGAVVDMDSISTQKLKKIILSLPDLNYDSEKIDLYQWSEITKRLINKD